MNFNFLKGNYLRITFLAGIILFVITGGLLTVLWFIDREKSKTTRQEDSFVRIMREYDISAGMFTGTERELEKLNSELDRLEKRAISIESWLSVLKRRRALVNYHHSYQKSYRDSVMKALKIYPFSQPLAAVAAAAFIKDTAVNRQTEEQLRALLPLISDPSFNSLRLSLHILLGDFKNPEKAAQLPDFISSDGIENIAVDLAITKILRGDFRGASAEIQNLLNSPAAPSVESIRFAAQYYYDFGDLSRSAELFSRINDEPAMVQMADALYLAGFTDSARAIWSILAENLNENSLYNLAVTAKDKNEAFTFLEKLTGTDFDFTKDSRRYGIIRYSRLLPYDRAIKELEDAQKLMPSGFPFIDLEIRKQQALWQEPGRQVAEAWLLLDRHPENEGLYQWAARLFFFQRYYDEAKILLKRAENLQLEGQWLSIYKAIQLMQEGYLENAAGILRRSAEDADWNVYANMGRILEAQFSPSRALLQYELALSNVQNMKTKADIQFRIAKCFLSLSSPREARRALEYALELDPDNITAQFELEKMLF